MRSADNKTQPEAVSVGGSEDRFDDNDQAKIDLSEHDRPSESMIVPGSEIQDHHESESDVVQAGFNAAEDDISPRVAVFAEAYVHADGDDDASEDTTIDAPMESEEAQETLSQDTPFPMQRTADDESDAPGDQSSSVGEPEDSMQSRSDELVADSDSGSHGSAPDDINEEKGSVVASEPPAVKSEIQEQEGRPSLTRESSASSFSLEAEPQSKCEDLDNEGSVSYTHLTLPTKA